MVDITLLGTSIRNFAIVRDADNIAVAYYIADAIRELTGISIPVRTVQDAETAYEILVGDTGRDATSAEVPAGKFTVNTAGTKLALYGNDHLAAYRAARHFVDTYLTGASAAITVTPVTLDSGSESIYELNLPAELPPMELENTLNTGGVMERFLKAKEELPTEVTVLDPIDINEYPLSLRRRQLYVDPNNGNDENPGTIDKPLATLAEAVDRMTAGGGVIWLREGIHEVHSSLKLTEKVSGTPTSPLFIKAYGDETARVTTHKEIKNEWFQSLSADDPMIDRFDEALDLQFIFYVDLADYGFTKDDITEIVSASDAYGVNKTSGRSGATPVLLIGGTEYNIARYPNAGEKELSFACAYDSGRVTSSTGSEIYFDWLERVATSGETFEGKPLTATTPLPWQISLGERNRAQQNKANINNADAAKKYVSYQNSKNWERYAPILEWVDTGNIWFYGRPYSDWDVGKYPVTVGIQPDGSYACYQGDPDKPAIISKMPASLGASDRESAGHGHEFYLFNAIEALDVPGEWFIDEESDGLRLYIYPPDEFYAVESFSYTGSYTGAALNIESATNVVIDGIEFAGVGTTAISHADTAPQIHDVVIQNCTFRNMNTGVSITGLNRKIAVLYSSFGVAHGRMLYMMNAASTNLVPDHNVVQNCTFGEPIPTQQEGITFGGCQSVVSHNFLTDTNININGPAYECIVEYNRCDGGSRDVGDGGMVYMYGLLTRGCHTRYNVLHGANYTGNAIYNDGMCSGNYAYYNLASFLTGYREGSQKCHYVSTGHANVCFNNVFIVRTWQRYAENMAASGKTPMKPIPTALPGGGTMTRVRGDMAINESTLFYADLTDYGYEMGSLNAEDAASYSWDRLYNGAATRYTGRANDRYFDMEKFLERFPLFMDEMQGAYDMFQVISASGKDYDRRDAVVALEDKYDAAVIEKLVELGVLDENWVAERTATLQNTPYSATDARARARDELRRTLDHYNEAKMTARTNELKLENYSYEDALRKARKEARGLATVDEESLRIADAAAFRLGYGYTEDYYRQPAYNVYVNNVMMGGDLDVYFDNDHDGIGGEEPRDFVNSDYISTGLSVDDAGNLVQGGSTLAPYAKDLRVIGANYYNLDWNEVFVDCDKPSDKMSTADYTFQPGALESIRDVVPEFYDFVDLVWSRWEGK